MSIIKLENITKIYGDKLILDKVSLDINEGDKVGIIGLNGSGKSTLVKIIMGLEAADSGKVWISNNASLGYLRQVTDYKADDFIDMSLDRENVSNFFKVMGEFNMDKTLEFSDSRLANLSGGEKTKLAIACVLSSNPNTLILDEPTNHVDIDSVEWLINLINGYNGTALIVSHDRYFLNHTVNKIIEVKDGKIKLFYGNYDDYEHEKKKEFELLKSRYELQQKRDKKITSEISQLKNWSEKGERQAGRQFKSRSDSKVKGVKTNAQRKAAKASRSAESKKTCLNQMREDYIEKPREDKDVKFNFMGESNSSDVLIKTFDLSKSFEDNLVFSKANLYVNRNDKIGLIGPNGCGKTTFIKLLMDKLCLDSGEIWKSLSLKIAYMSQDVFDLDGEKTIFQMASDYDNEKKQFFYSNLVNMGFDRNLFNHKIKTLSLGEQMRLKLTQIIINDYNLLILDEPTNHLDLPNKIELEKALLKYPGAIIMASHDKYLLSKVTNKVFVFKDHMIQRYEDGYSDFISKGKN